MIARRLNLVVDIESNIKGNSKLYSKCPADGYSFAP